MNLLKNNMKRIVSTMLVFTLVFSIMLPLTQIEVEAADEVSHEVNIRIEGSDRTIVEPTDVQIDSLDLSAYPGIEKSSDDFDSLKPIHAIIKGLEGKAIDPKKPENFGIESSSYGLYITMVGGVSGQGWGYTVDNKAANLGVGDYEIKSGQDIVLYNMETYEGSAYSWFEKESIEVEANEEFDLILKGENSYGSTLAPNGLIEGASILVDEEDYKEDGELIKTDSDGKVSLKLEEEGSYHISAKKENDKGQNIISRPYTSVRVGPGKVDKEEVDKETGNEETNKDETNNEEIKDEEVKDLSVNTKELNKAIEKTLDYYRKNNPGKPSGDWEAYVGLWGLNEKIPMGYDWEKTKPELDEAASSNDIMTHAYALLARGKDPSDIWGGENLFAKLADQQDEDGKFTSIWKHPWAMVLLEAGEDMGVDLGTWNDTSKEKAIDQLLKMQNEDGSFGSFSKLDGTGAALIALSRYEEQAPVKLAIDKALGFLVDNQVKSGGFAFDEGWGKDESSNSIALVIQGLIAVGEDIVDSEGKWSKDGKTPVDGLLRFQKDNGEFLWQLDEDITGSATKQSLVALADIKNASSTWVRLGKDFKEEDLKDEDAVTVIPGGKDEDKEDVGKDTVIPGGHDNDMDASAGEDYMDTSGNEASPKTGDKGIAIPIVLSLISSITLGILAKKRKVS